MTRLVLPNGFCGLAPLGRKGRDSGPCISSRWGLCILEGVEGPPVERASPRPSPREERGEGEEGAPPRKEAPPRFFIEPAGKFAASPYFFIPAYAPALAATPRCLMVGSSTTASSVARRRLTSSRSLAASSKFKSAAA